MITELYRITPLPLDELTALIEDGDNSLLREQLGLPPVELKNNTPFRYRLITDEEKKVFKVLFPNTTKLESYTDFIPNEVLEAMQEVKDTCPYKLVSQPYIMSPKEFDPDPVLVCPVRTVQDAHDWVNGEILVARWGSSLLPFEQLREKAVKLWKAAREIELRKIQRRVAEELADLPLRQEITDIDKPSLHNV